MVTLSSLLLPIVLSAVFVFVASSVIHMLLPYHKNDFAKLPNEDAVLSTLRSADVSPGEYVLPHASGSEERKSPEFQKKLDAGKVAFVTVLPGGQPSMGKSLGQWFVYCLVVALFAAYLTGRVLPAGADYLSVFQVAGTTAFAGFVLALWQESIWYGRPWGNTLKSTVDGLIYALLTAGTFGWLWPA
ncbi:MAG: hypothetical protein WD423_10055 [Rhodothermales bacterium]